MKDLLVQYAFAQHLVCAGRCAEMLGVSGRGWWGYQEE